MVRRADRPLSPGVYLLMMTLAVLVGGFPALVFVPPEVFRTAVAAEDGTIVFVVGGTVGEAFDATTQEQLA